MTTILVRSVAGPQPAPIDGSVLATNLFLTLLIVLIFGITSSLFNSTIDENRAEIEGWRAALMLRLRPLARPPNRLERFIAWAEGPGRGPRATRIVGILALTGLIYGFLSPDFGLNAQSLILFVSLAIGLGIVTYLAEGGSSFLAEKQYKVESSVRLYGSAIIIAAISVAISRLLDFQPGIVYGFVASSLVIAPVALDRRASAQLVILPALGLLAASLLAWILLAPLQAAVNGGGGPFWALLDSIAVIVFVAGLEGVFYSLIPLTFMDGAQVLQWSRVVWAVLFGTVTFLFFQLIVNQYKSYLDAFKQTSVVLCLALAAFYGIVTVGVWLFFRLRTRRSPEAA